MVDSFTKEEFEKAFPPHRKDPNALKHVGIINGEHCYTYKIDENAQIFIRSSIDSSGKSASAGEDSIRLFLVNRNCAPFASKLNSWVTRVPGWQNRLAESMRKLARLYKAAGLYNGMPRPIYKAKANTPNQGRFFTPQVGDLHFKWLTDNKGNLIE
jgi:hypothetical protein